MSNAILRARELLGDLTPLKTDCGRLCGGACCQGESRDEQRRGAYQGSFHFQFASSRLLCAAPFHLTQTIL